MEFSEDLKKRLLEEFFRVKDEEFDPKGKIIRELCQLSKEVWETIDPNAYVANDCFCYESPREFRHGRESIEFIIAATRNALAAYREHVDVLEKQKDWRTFLARTA